MTETEYLRKIYLKAETDIINEIARLRARGLVDYHAVAALQRVQKILMDLQDRSWVYVPRMIEKQFYINHPERYTRAAKTLLEHAIGYASAVALSIDEVNVVARLTASCMANLSQAANTVVQNLSEVLLGRRDDDLFRYAGIETVTRIQATGQSLRAPSDFVEQLRREGLTAFVDKAGRHWNLNTYADMVVRTTSRQAEVQAVLLRDPDHDLYMISKNNSGCAVCAPLEGRVYSRSGTSPYYPPLADAFGKVDKYGPNTLENSWLNIHPNCRHALIPWTEAGKTPAEIAKARRFSDPRTNPYDRDPRTEKQITAYKNRERARREILETYEQFERYRLVIPDKTPKTFDTFRKHKELNDEKYKAWQQAYREAEKRF